MSETAGPVPQACDARPGEVQREGSQERARGVAAGGREARVAGARELGGRGNVGGVV
jgi:hypothetical protein